MNKKKFNIITAALSLIVVVLYAICIGSNAENDKAKIEVEKINGKFSALGNIGLKTLVKESTMSATELTINSDGDKIEKDIKYDYYRGVGEEVLNDKKLYRQTLRTSQIQSISEDDQFKTIVYTSERNGNGDTYINTINVVYKNKENNKVKSFKHVQKNSGWIDTLYSTSVDGKVYFLTTLAGNMEKPEKVNNLILYEADLKEECVREIKTFDLGEKYINSYSRALVRGDKIYFSLENKVKYNSEVKVSIGCVDVKALEFNVFDTKVFNNKNFNLDLVKDYYIDGDTAYILVDLKNYVEGIKKCSLLTFDMKEDKFISNKELKLYDKIAINIGDFAIDDDNIIYLYTEEENKYINNRKTYLKILNMESGNVQFLGEVKNGKMLQDIELVKTK